MKIRVVEFRYIHSNPALWLFVFTLDSLLFMLGLVYCLQKGVFALIAVFPLFLYGVTAWLYERSRHKAPSLLVDVDSVKWRTGPEDRNRIRFGKVESITLYENEEDLKIVIQEKEGQEHSVAIDGLVSRKYELARVLRKKAKEYGFILAE